MVKRSPQSGDSAGEPHGRPTQLDPQRPKSFYKLNAPNELALAADPQRGAAGSDPYNLVRGTSQLAAEPRQPRSLDDMRRLSDAIRTAPNWTRPRSTTSSALYRRLGELRGELERTLAEVQGLREGASASAAANRHLVELMGQLRDAVYHLEGAVVCLKNAGGLV